MTLIKNKQNFEILSAGIYDISQYNAARKPTKVMQVPTTSFFSKLYNTFFSRNSLQLIEETSLITQSQDGNIRIIRSNQNKEDYLLQKISDRHVAVIVANDLMLNRIKNDDVKLLFVNIRHAFLRPEKVHVTLDDIIKNPSSYMEKDLLISATRDAIDAAHESARAEVNRVLIGNMDAIDHLVDTTEFLAPPSCRFY